MQFLRLFIPVVAAFVLTSCLTIEEKLTLRKDGSGVYSTSVDLGEMLSNPFIKMAMEEEVTKEGKEMESMQMDSTIDLFAELAPHNPQWSEADKELVRAIDTRIRMDLEKGEGAFVTSYPFSTLDQLETAMDLIANSNQPEKEEGDGGPDSPFSSNGTLSNAINDFTWKKGRFSRESKPGEQMRDLMGDDENMEMAKMMFTDAKVVYLMEFPGKIKKVTGFEGHTIVDGNTLKLSFPLLDFMDSPDAIDAAMDGQVKYK